MLCSVVALGPPCRWPRGRRGPHWARESGADRRGGGGGGASRKCRSRSALPGRIVTREEGDSIGFRQLVGTSFRRRGTGAECRRRWPWGREGAWLPATPPQPRHRWPPPPATCRRLLPHRGPSAPSPDPEPLGAEGSKAPPAGRLGSRMPADASSLDSGTGGKCISAVLSPLPWHMALGLSSGDTHQTPASGAGDGKESFGGSPGCCPPAQNPVGGRGSSGTFLRVVICHPWLNIVPPSALG